MVTVRLTVALVDALSQIASLYRHLPSPTRGLSTVLLAAEV